MPTQLRESLHFRPQFIEGTYSPSKRTVDVTIISEGLGNKRDKHFYTAQVLQRAVSEKVFEGAKAFADHPSKFDESNLPERSIRDQIGYYFNVHSASTRDPNTGRGVESIAATFKIQEGQDWVDGLIRESIAYKSKFPDRAYSGISINADGDAEPKTIDGQEVRAVTHISEVISADVVTLPARGGGFIRFAESAHRRYSKEVAMLKTVADAAQQIEKIAEGESVEPKTLLAIAKTLREAGGGKCAECDHAQSMHEGEDKACEAKDCECEAFVPFKKKEAKDSSDEPDDDTDDQKEDDGEEREGDTEESDGEDDGDDDEEPKGKKETKKESTDTGIGPKGDQHLNSKRESDIPMAQLRRRYPSLYAAALKEAESHVGQDLVTLRRENRQLKAQIALHESRSIALRKLSESQLPELAHDKVLIQLIGASPEEMDEIIDAETRYLEAAGVRKGKLVEGAGARNGRVHVRESSVDSLTKELVAGIGEVA